MADCEGMQVSIVDGIVTIKFKAIPHTSVSGKCTLLGSTVGCKQVPGLVYGDKGLWLNCSMGLNKR